MPEASKPDPARDLDHNGIVDAADDRSRDLNRDGVLDADDRSVNDLNHDNAIDGTDQKLEGKQKLQPTQKVGEAIGWSNDGGSWQPPENSNKNSNALKRGPKVG